MGQDLVQKKNRRRKKKKENWDWIGLRMLGKTTVCGASLAGDVRDLMDVRACNKKQRFVRAVH